MLMLPVVPLKVIEFDVVAFEVEALDVIKLDEEPKRVVMFAEIADKTFANRFVSTFRFVIEEVAAIKLFVEMLVEVELVIVPFATSIAGSERFVTDKFVTVAEVIVALVPIKLVVFVVMKFEVEAFVVEERIVVN